MTVPFEKSYYPYPVKLDGQPLLLYLTIEKNATIRLRFDYGHTEYKMSIMRDSPSFFELLRRRYMEETGDKKYAGICHTCGHGIPHTTTTTHAPPISNVWDIFFFMSTPPPAPVDVNANEFAKKICFDFMTCLDFVMKKYGDKLLFYAVKLKGPKRDYETDSYSRLIERLVFEIIISSNIVQEGLKTESYTQWKTSSSSDDSSIKS